MICNNVRCERILPRSSIIAQFTILKESPTLFALNIIVAALHTTLQCIMKCRAQWVIFLIRHSCHRCIQIGITQSHQSAAMQSNSPQLCTLLLLKWTCAEIKHARAEFWVRQLKAQTKVSLKQLKKLILLFGSKASRRWLSCPHPSLTPNETA